MDTHGLLTAGTGVSLCALLLATPVARAADAAPPAPVQESRASERIFDPARNWGEDKSYVIPALDILGFQFLLNRFDNAFEGPEYKVTFDSIRRNLHHHWVADNDPFKVNQFLHPYQGSIYHGFARSAGLNYWESLGYTFAGAAVWEIAGETTPPSRNDLIASGIAGSFLGEALFRMANLVLEKDQIPPFWREVSAAVISPSTGFNRLAFGERFKGVFDSHDPARYSRFAVGASATTQNEPGTSNKLRRNEALLDYSLDYGLPGKPGYTYHRPFDYFSFQATASSANVFEQIVTRGLLYGADYGFGESYRGIWGLYGTYDYLAPQFFRVSSTALSVGTTAQWWATRDIALQGTGLIGTGYTGVATLGGTSDQDYHYGLAPQALATLRLIYGDTLSLDATAREYFVSRVAGGGRGGHDNIVRGETALTWRIQGPHAVALRYLWTRRDASYAGLGEVSQSHGTIGLFYTLLGHDRFGAVDWR